MKDDDYCYQCGRWAPLSHVALCDRCESLWPHDLTDDDDGFDRWDTTLGITRLAAD